MAETQVTTQTTSTTGKSATEMMARAETWIKANPIPAVLIAAVVGGVLLGDGKRRW